MRFNHQIPSALRRGALGGRGVVRRVGPAWLTNFGAVTVNYGLLAVLLGLFAIVTGRVLGPSDRGVVVLFMTLGSMLMVAGSLGTNTYARVALVRTQNPLALRDYMGLVHVLAGFQILLAIAFGGAVLHFTHTLTGPLVLVLLAGYSMLNVVSYLMRDGLYAFGYNKQASRADPIAAGMQLLLVSALWVTRNVTLPNTLLVIAVGQTAEVVYLVLCYPRRGLRLIGRYRWALLTEQIVGGLPAMISNFGQTMLLRLDRILLGLFSTTAVVGIYSVAATSAEMLLLVPTAISQVIFHRVATGRQHLQKLTRLRVGNLGLAAIAAIVLVLIAPLFIDVVFGQAYHAAATPLRILAIAVIGMSAYLVDMACLNGAGRLRTASLVTIFGALIVTALDLTLIPAYAAVGAAAASAIGYICTAGYASNRLRRAARDSEPRTVAGDSANAANPPRLGPAPHAG